MSQTISNDYVSMINKSGSGYNIPEIVDAIVDAAIVPVKEIITAQKEKVDLSISGMGTLKSSMSATQTLVNSMSSDSHLTLQQCSKLKLHAIKCGGWIPSSSWST